MSSSVQKKIKQAEKYIKISEFAKAEAIYLEILKKFPQNQKALNALKNLKSVNKNISADTYKNLKLQELNNHYNKKEFAVVIQKANEFIKLYPKETNLYIIQGASNAASKEDDMNSQRMFTVQKSLRGVCVSSHSAWFRKVEGVCQPLG